MEKKKDPFKPSVIEKEDANLDPLSGAPGAHPVGVGAGAVSGGVAGAAIGGAIGGPIGAGIGTVIGGVAGGLAGKGVAEAVNPTEENAYWTKEYTKRTYVRPGASYDEYGPAYQYGWESYTTYYPQGKSFDEVEPQLRTDWERRRGKSTLSWENAKQATRDAWARLQK